MTATLSPPKPPSYLDPTTEILHSDQPASYAALNDRKKAIVFILLSYKSLAKLSKNIPTDSIISVIANSIVETGWGRYWKGWNFGGWKIGKGDVDAFKAKTGVCPPWWQAPGHVNSGDTEVCYYRGFAGPKTFYKEWIDRFVPKEASEKHRYFKTGKAFWEGKEWFPELIAAGYKGAVTKANPQPSIDAHEQIIKSVRTRIAQQLLGVEPDADWGKRSREACIAFQAKNGLPQTGTANSETIVKLLDKWEKDGMIIPHVIPTDIPEL